VRAVTIGARKAYFSCGCEWNFNDTFTVNPYDNLKFVSEKEKP
jgi:hypothetical protein